MGNNNSLSSFLVSFAAAYVGAKAAQAYFDNKEQQAKMQAQPIYNNQRRPEDMTFEERKAYYAKQGKFANGTDHIGHFKFKKTQ